MSMDDGFAFKRRITDACFNFNSRSKPFDWRLLHGINIDTAVSLDDFQAVEACLNTLQHGQLSLDKSLSMKNCHQLFCILQLALEYVHHLDASHSILLDWYTKAGDAAESWIRAGRAYLDDGRIFTMECDKMSAMSKKGLAQVDQFHAELEAADALYGQVIQALQNVEVRARHFRFKKQRLIEINWKQLHSIDVEEIVTNVDTATLAKITPSLMFGNIDSEDKEELTMHHFRHLITLSQCALDYAMHRANSTGFQLGLAMSRLRCSQRDMPDLVMAYADMHARLASIVLDARKTAIQQQTEGPLHGGSTSGLRAGSTSGLRAGYTWPDIPGLLPAFDLQNRAKELQHKVEALDQELRSERLRTEQLHRLMKGIQDVVSPAEDTPSTTQST